MEVPGMIVFKVLAKAVMVVKAAVAVASTMQTAISQESWAMI